MIGPPTIPCGSCPYRRDVPSGVWSAEEYAKLPPYDRETPLQPTGVFLCHQQDGAVCSGWAGCHDMDESLALRLAVGLGTMSAETVEAILDYESPVPLFASGAEAAEHGLARLEQPDARAVRTIQRLERKLGALAVACPVCGVAAGRSCDRPLMKKDRGWRSHQERWRALHRARASGDDRGTLAAMSEIVSPTELETLTDEQLVSLIVARSNLDEDAAREALTVIRDEVPAGEVF